MLHLLKFDPTQPFIARTAGRALASSLNLTTLNAVAQALRAERFGTPIESGESRPTIDVANDEIAAEHDAIESDANREEQGHVVPDKPLEVAARARLVRDYIAADLLKNAGTIELPLTGQRVTDQWHIAQDLADSFQFQLSSAPRVDDAKVKMEAKVLNVPEAEIRAALQDRHERQRQFLVENRQRILDMAQGLVSKDRDGHLMGREQAEQAFDLLPAIVRMRAAATADSALYRLRKREITRHMDGNEDALGTIGIVDGVRRELHTLVKDWQKSPAFVNELAVALSRSSGRGVKFPPPPAPVPASSEEEARAKHAAAAGK